MFGILENNHCWELAISRFWRDSGFRNCRVNFAQRQKELGAYFKVVNVLLCFFQFLFENTEMRPCVYMVCASAPWFITIKTMPEFMRRHLLAKGVKHFSVTCILVIDKSFYVGCLICRRCVPQEVRQVHLFMQEHEKRKPWRVIISSKYQLTIIYTKCWLWLSHWDESILLSYHICIKSQQLMSRKTNVKGT